MDDGKEHLMKDVNLEHMYCVQASPADGPDNVVALSSARVPSSFANLGLPVVILSLLLRVIKTRNIFKYGFIPQSLSEFLEQVLESRFGFSFGIFCSNYFYVLKMQQTSYKDKFCVEII